MDVMLVEAAQILFASLTGGVILGATYSLIFGAF